MGSKVCPISYFQVTLTARHLIDVLTDEGRDPNVHLFNSFFYTKISSKDHDKRYVPRGNRAE